MEELNVTLMFQVLFGAAAVLAVVFGYLYGKEKSETKNLWERLDNAQIKALDAQGDYTRELNDHITAAIQLRSAHKTAIKQRDFWKAEHDAEVILYESMLFTLFESFNYYTMRVNRQKGSKHEKVTRSDLIVDAAQYSLAKFQDKEDLRLLGVAGASVADKLTKSTPKAG